MSRKSRSLSALMFTSLVTTGCLIGCGSTGSGRSSQNWTYKPVETMPDHEYTGPLRSASSSSANAPTSDHVRFNAPTEAYSANDGASQNLAFGGPKMTYYYYPSSEVYFEPKTSTYFWQSAPNVWQHGDRLPRSIRLQQSERELVQLRTSQPYRYHSKITVAYPAGGILSIVDTDY